MVKVESPHEVWERNFREQMFRLREARGLTQTDLAKILKSRFGLPFHQPTIQRIEVGERPVRLNEAHLIARILDVDLETMTDRKTPSEREISYSVDRLFNEISDGTRDLKSLIRILDEWVSMISAAINRRQLAKDPADEIDYVTLWAIAWIIKTSEILSDLLNAQQKSWDFTQLSEDEPLDSDPFAANAANLRAKYPRAAELAAKSPSELYDDYRTTMAGDKYIQIQSDIERGK